MKRLFTFISLSIFAVSCSNNNELNILLEGEWNDGLNNFSFRKSTLLHNSTFNEFEISGDTVILINTSPEPANRSIIYKYQILQISKDTLIIKEVKAVGKNAPIVGGDESIEQDIIFNLHRTKKMNNLKPLNIAFSSSICFGPCPVMHIELDSSGRTIFWGREFTELIGGFRGYSNSFPFLVKLTQDIDFDCLNNDYGDILDGASYSIRIIYQEDTIQSSGSRVPSELNVLFCYLKEVYKTATLFPDTSIFRELEIIRTRRK